MLHISPLVCVYLVELRWVDASCIVVEQQLIAELRYCHRPDVSNFEQILDWSTSVDVHGS